MVLIAGAGLGVGALAARAVAQVGACAVVAQREGGPALQAGALGPGEIVLAELGGHEPTLFCEEMVAQTGRLDALIYCAAPALVSPYWQLDEEAWLRGVSEPLLDVHRWVRAAMLQMRTQKFGTIVVVGPAAGLEPNDDRVALNTLGGAIRGFVEALAYAGLRSNVQCYALRLGARPVDVAGPPEAVWPELGPQLIALVSGRHEIASGGLVDIPTAPL